MLDKLYANIGEKIKYWAKWIFIIETISAVIGAVSLMVNDAFFYGWNCLIVGPIVAFVSTSLLYAFGEIAEDISLMRQKYVGDKATQPQTPSASKKAPTPTVPNKVPEPHTKKETDTLKQADLQSIWDHWKEEDTSIGQCEVCGAKRQFLAYAEYIEDGQTQQKNLCCDCFLRRDCKPATHT